MRKPSKTPTTIAEWLSMAARLAGRSDSEQIVFLADALDWEVNRMRQIYRGELIPSHGEVCRLWEAAGPHIPPPP